jgi:hypothetical protein
MSDHAIEIAKGAPPVTVAALSFFGVSVPDAIQFLTLLWTAGLVVQMTYRFYRFLTAWFKARGSH